MGKYVKEQLLSNFYLCYQKHHNLLDIITKPGSGFVFNSGHIKSHTDTKGV